MLTKVFAALLKEGPVGCKDTVLPDPLLKKTFRQLFNNWGVYPIAMQWYFIPVQNSGIAFAWKGETEGWNFHKTHHIPQKNWWNWSCKLSNCLFYRYCSIWGNSEEHVICCTILNLWQDPSLSSLRADMWGKVLILYFYHVTTIVVVAFSPMSTFFSKPIIALRVINSSKLHSIWKCNMTTWKKRATFIFPMHMYQLRETLFHNLDSFSIPYAD